LGGGPGLGGGSIKKKLASSLSSGVESFTIFTINFSIHGSNKRFFDNIYVGSRAESSIHVVKIM